MWGAIAPLVYMLGLCRHYISPEGLSVTVCNTEHCSADCPSPAFSSHLYLTRPQHTVSVSHLNHMFYPCKYYIYTYISLCEIELS